ncbi:metallophosphoesterase family protein [Longispora albida]|uniref:metallophosphoesterase family protein n=1 Tax=Longispora albida TaxID=203523 RepID=UPI00037D5D55|nr:metallophosphoesterase [Longispora albida]
MTVSRGKLLAISDLHAGRPDNRAFTEAIQPDGPHDWLLLAGDLGDLAADTEWVLRTMSSRFSTVVWAPGNHELWTLPADPVQLRGAERYEYLVGVCRELGVHTPDDPYPVFAGESGPVTVVPMFLLYDYSFLPDGATTPEEGLAIAHKAQVVCTDEYYLHPDPYPSRAAWSAARIDYTQKRLDALGPDVRTVLVNHFPLTRHPTRVLRYPEFALWCGSERTADWHVRYNAAAVVYGHLHIPRRMEHDGVPFEEVSLGYPREWRQRPVQPRVPKEIIV